MTLAKQPDISVRDTLNYQNNYRNTIGFLVGMTYKAAKLNILIISFVCVCRWSFIIVKCGTYITTCHAIYL